MRSYLTQKRLLLSTFGLAFILGCERKAPQAQTSNIPAKPSNVTLDDVKRDAATSMKSTAAYSQQEKDKLVADMKANLAVIDANIEQMRVKGKDLASDAKAKWDLKMAAIDEKRKLASERIAEVEESTSKAWDGVAAAATSAWEELSKALQDASKEF
jgi:hypothetical protein